MKLILFVAFSGIINIPHAGGTFEHEITDEVFLDITMGGKDIGKITIGLFGNVVPKTVKNFMTICTEGVNGKSYAGSIFHRVIQGFMIQGGDILEGNGMGTISSYGETFPDENFIIKHTGPGMVSMANSGPDSNGSQFFITLAATKWLDGKHVVFGKVVNGMKVVKQIAKTEVGSQSKPIRQIVIKSCSHQPVEKPYIPGQNDN